MKKTTRQHTTLRLAAIVLALWGAAGIASAGSGRCVTAVIPTAFALPDGSVHEAGPLRICHDRDYSPVAGLHTTWVHANAVASFISRMDLSEGAERNAAPYLQFLDLHTGVWLLQGYAVPEGGRYRTFELGPARPARGAGLDLERIAQMLDEEDVVLVAAAAR